MSTTRPEIPDMSIDPRDAMSATSCLPFHHLPNVRPVTYFW
ncbi:hypothetical protein OHA63_29680 [Streptomyces anulatus]|nr:hypothetical protein [Streptomyces anulatus]